jgi:hypothetical protein
MQGARWADPARCRRYLGDECLRVVLVEEEEPDLPVVLRLTMDQTSSQAAYSREAWGGHTSPVTSTNSFFLLATVYTGIGDRRALTSSLGMARSKTGCGFLLPWPGMLKDSDCTQLSHDTGADGVDGGWVRRALTAKEASIA